MINVNQMTSQLARMPDQALQQYAQMHKHDPYIMSLAVTESNRRKTIRTGAQMNAPEEPKVVDQAIQSMAAPMPEDVGIAQLPTGEMNYAEGGIVAFSDGGDVPRFQDRGLVQSSLKTGDPLFDIPGMTQGDLYAKALAKARQDKQGGGEPTNQDIKKALAFLSAPLAAAADVAVSPINFLRRSLTTPLTKEAENPPSFTPVMDARNRFLYGQPGQAAPAAPADPAAFAGAGSSAEQAAINAAFKTAGRSPAPPAPPPAAPKVAAGPRSPAATAAAASSFAPSQDKIPTPAEIQRMFAAGRPKPEDVTDPFAAQREEQTNLAVFQNAEERADFERQVKERGVLGAKQEARLKAREEKLGKQEKDLGPLAMLQAGFAIMSGSSRSALQNIGAGAQVGLKGYTEGLDKLQTARERIEDGLERVETARRSEGMMNDQERRALRREGNAIVREGKKEGINALTTEFSLRRGEANTLLTVGINSLTRQAELGSAERLGDAQMKNQVTVANIGAAATRDNAAATRSLAENTRMSALAESVRKNIADEAVKRFPYSTTDQATYQQQAMRAALRSNPGLAQYLGVSGGGDAPAAETATHRLNPATGKIEPVR
jgi:hypothetical protein